MQLIKAPRDAILKPLSVVSGIVERRHTLPILANILIKKDGSKVSFVSTDIEVQINKLIDEERMPEFVAYTPRVKVEEAPKPPSKPVFGRRAAKRYTNRL